MEYKALSSAQKEDLDKWRATPDGQAATKKAKQEYFDTIQKPKVSCTKDKKKSSKNKRLKKKKETKKSKAALAFLLKDDSSEEDFESIVKALAKLKKNMVKAKVTSSEGLSNQLKAKSGDGIAKLMKFISSVE